MGINKMNFGSIKALPQQVVVDQKVEFLTIQTILGEKKVLYTTLDCDQSLIPVGDEQPQDRFKKLMPRKLTLVMEMVDILVKIVDVNSEQAFPLQDQSMHQIAVPKKDDPNSKEIILMRFMEQALLKSLRELQSYCELILYSYLPRAFIEKLISAHLPEFNNIFSYILGRLRT
ncbi:hypothetical protein FGO68_gene2101 [Halteria grandinella]|uniref:Uncharacterized protein n=1 Tax=Halteria grandinella TaxID=5974 RepID=A0A8J8P3B5_HALGN|nr:hypothetical protein FGO68_gene2101 [Halteria grandinella]